MTESDKRGESHDGKPPSGTSGASGSAGAAGTPPTPQAPDLAEWRQGTAAPAPTPAVPERPKDPKVEWGNLGGVRGMVVVRVAHGVAEKPDGHGGIRAFPWVGATVLLPPTTKHPKGYRVFCLTSETTTAGKDFMAALRRGILDGVSEDHPVPVAVRTQLSDDPKKQGRPMAFLTFG